ncbi:unnamed protein product [Phyllotreta striolata]|uniref:FAM69 protein-kinase domain-containing protein n=1 Tax=Phyllotreta striolata TaxID=444603 RepID=A0A9N9XQ42_PHYSR|nr:unnamed protein product [Phyllotreta striolata]
MKSVPVKPLAKIEADVDLRLQVRVIVEAKEDEISDLADLEVGIGLRKSTRETEFTSKPKKRSSSESSSSSSSGGKQDKYKSKRKENTASKEKEITNKSKKSDKRDSPDCVIVDNDILEEINDNSFAPKQFTSSKSKKVPDNIVIDLRKNTIKVPEIEQVEPDSIFHHSLFLNEEARMEKWVRELYTFRQKALQQGAKIIKQKTVSELCEIKSCPYCYGKNMCNEIAKNKITLHYGRVSDFIYNILSVKNVFFATYDNKPVILKKLAHNSELRKFDREINDKIINLKLLKGTLNFKLTQTLDNSEFPPFYICDNETFDAFWEVLNLSNIKSTYTVLSINAEPILFQLFNKEQAFPVPKFYGACGRLTVQENAGRPLLNIEKFTWYQRAKVAFNLLNAALNFTDKHREFRLYLTDISPDNIAVDHDLEVSFIDLEHAILKKKSSDSSSSKTHYTRHDEVEYSFDPKAICAGTLSDHNVYGICRLLLSKNAPWPMMEGGLLYNPPKNITSRHSKLFSHIEACVDSDTKESRFDISNKILKDLEFILKKAKIKNLI